MKRTIETSYYGDADPEYSGSVVKAMASAKKGYKLISEKVCSILGVCGDHVKFFRKLNNSLDSTIKEVNILGPKIVEIVIHSELASCNFRPGQFYKIQNYHNEDCCLIEPIALTGASSDLENNLISVIALEIGRSTKYLKYMKPGQKIALMGPVGEPTRIPIKKNIMLIGGGLGNAVLFSIGKAMRSKDCKVMYFAGYTKPDNIFKPEQIELAADLVVWSCDEGFYSPRRKNDLFFRGNINDSIESYLKSENKNNLLKSIDEVLIIGSDRMMSAVGLNIIESNFLKPECKLIAVLNSPMQCMMNGICGQCIQKLKKSSSNSFHDEEYIYSCKNQEQGLKYIDFEFLNNRLKQNSLAEKISDSI